MNKINNIRCIERLKDWPRKNEKKMIIYNIGRESGESQKIFENCLTIVTVYDNG